MGFRNRNEAGIAIPLLSNSTSESHEGGSTPVPTYSLVMRYSNMVQNMFWDVKSQLFITTVLYN